MRAFWPVNQLLFIVPVNSWSIREKLYVSDQFNRFEMPMPNEVEICIQQDHQDNFF